jgi:hypothetical protein
MAKRIPRRRAAARGLALLGGVAFSQVWRTGPAAAQPLDPPGDVPWPAVTPPAAGDLPLDPIGQVNDETEPADAPVPVAGPWGVPPVKLTIPALGVEAAVQPVGLDADGAMGTPTQPDDVAWYELGPGMGVPGNVVLAAHVNWNGRLRPFGLLHTLEPGDAVQVIDAEGRGFEYQVESSHWVRAEGAPLAEIFAQPEQPVVTLITCGGEYVAATREYLDRLIVRARGA